MTEYLNIAFHPYIKKIEEMCLNDEPATKISNWVKHTVDEDQNIPAESKQAYYVTPAKINNYKKLLKESVKDLTVKIEKDSERIDAVDVSNVSIVPNGLAPAKKIIEVHSEKNLVKIHQTLMNLAERIETQLNNIELYLRTQTIIDPEMHKTYRGYINSMTDLLKQLSEVTGYKDFFKKMGENMGDATSKKIIDDNFKNKLKSFIHSLLMEVGDIDKIPEYLEKLDKILEDNQ